MSKSKPTLMPAETSGSSEQLEGQSMPIELSDEVLALASSADSVPTLEPPSALSEEEAATVWLENKRITALWGINQNRNSWVNVVGVGWKRLANNSDSAVVALTMLASHAKYLNAPVNYREESDSMIHEMYVW